MDLDVQGAPARGLRRYVRLVAEAIGVGTEASTVQFDHPVSVYLALDRRHPTFPDRDLALLWDERFGWALGAEADSSADVQVVGYLAVDVLPLPEIVAKYVETACRTGDRGVPVAPTFDPVDLVSQLIGYATRGRDHSRVLRPAVVGSPGEPATAQAARLR